MSYVVALQVFMLWLKLYIVYTCTYSTQPHSFNINLSMSLYQSILFVPETLRSFYCVIFPA